MFLHNVFEYAEEDDDVQATRDFATLMDHGYINKYISSKSNYISVHLLLSSKFIALRGKLHFQNITMSDVYFFFFS